MALDRPAAPAQTTSVAGGVGGVGARAAGGIGERIGQILALHREGTDGWCLGCAEEGTLRFHPCPSASWASNVGCGAESGRYHGTTPGAWRSP